MPALDLSNKLLQLLDSDLYELIELGGGQPTFALSWILTWFAHDISDLSKVQLVYDACLATHPLFCVYIAVAQIVKCKQKLIEHEQPEISGFIVFKEARESNGFEVQESILLAFQYFKKHPPREVFKLIEQENGKDQKQRKLFQKDSPFVRFELEKLYLSNNRLTSS